MVRFVLILAAFGLVWLLSRGADAGVSAVRIEGGLRLIMVDDAGCSYCAKWDAEVGSAYPLSAEGRLAPLVRRPKRHADLQAYEPLAYTPTFVLVQDGRELGRIVGYPGADFFWGELGQLLAKSGAVPGQNAPEFRPTPAPRDVHRRHRGAPIGDHRASIGH